MMKRVHESETGRMCETHASDGHHNIDMPDVFPIHRPTSIDEMSAGESEVPTSVTAVSHARLRRRRLLQAAAAALVALGLVAAGTGIKFRITPKPPPPAAVNQLVVLDGIYASQGTPGLLALLNPATGTEQDAIAVLRWIRERQVAAEYGLLLSEFTETRGQVKSAAVGNALLLRPVMLKPHQSTLDGLASAEPDADFKLIMKRLADKVRRS